jgi:hypothetical protein
MLAAGLWAATIVAFGFAAGLGGRPDRLAVGTLLASALLSTLVKDLQVDDLRWGVALVDALAFLLLTALATRYDRWWLIVAAGLQLVVVLTHVAAIGPGFIFNWTAVSIRWVTWLALLAATGTGAIEAHVIRRYRLEAHHNA